MDAQAQAIIGELTKSMGQAVDAFAEITKLRAKAEEAASAAAEASKRTGISVHATVFEDSAKSLQTFARVWLSVTALLAVATAAVAIGFQQVAPFIGLDFDATTPGKWIPYVTSKVILLGLGISATIWTGGVYKALRHQVTLNHHRANALTTFRTFVAGTDDPDIKNAILLEATRSIFAVGPSGFLGDKDQTDIGSRVLEIVKSASALGPKP